MPQPNIHTWITHRRSSAADDLLETLAFTLTLIVFTCCISLLAYMLAAPFFLTATYLALTVGLSALCVYLAWHMDAMARAESQSATAPQLHTHNPGPMHQLWSTEGLLPKLLQWLDLDSLGRSKSVQRSWDDAVSLAIPYPRHTVTTPIVVKNSPLCSSYYFINRAQQLFVLGGDNYLSLPGSRARYDSPTDPLLELRIHNTHPNRIALPDNTKVAKLYFFNTITFVLTTDDKVYVLGYCSSDTCARATGLGLSSPFFGAIVPTRLHFRDAKGGEEKITRLYMSQYSKEAVIALTEAGRLYSWGTGRYVLGLGDTVATNQPTQLAIPADEIIVELIPGRYFFTVARAKSGRLYTWGVCTYYNDDTEACSIGQPQPTSLELPASQSAARIFPSSGGAFVLTTSNQLFAWGCNDFGQLGVGDRRYRQQPTLVNFAEAKSIERMFSYMRSQLALLADGRLYAWGNNEHGLLGIGQEPRVQTTPRQVRFPADARLRQLNSATENNVALTHSGIIYVWGAGYKHHGGLVKDTFEPQPIELPAGEVVTQICGWHYALTQRGNIYSWSLNCDKTTICVSKIWTSQPGVEVATKLQQSSNCVFALIASGKTVRLQKMDISYPSLYTPDSAAPLDQGPYHWPITTPSVKLASLIRFSADDKTRQRKLDDRANEQSLDYSEGIGVEPPSFG